MTQVFLLTGTTTWATPGDWNNSSNTVECVGEGGNGGGAYAASTNLTLSGTINTQIGAGASATTTQFKDGSTLVADYGRTGSGASGGLSANCVGTTKTSGGNAGTTQVGKQTDYGGGGASAGPSGAGKNGGNALANVAGGGGGGANGGSSTAGSNAGANGGNGGDGTGGTGHGIGAVTAGADATDGTAGGGGGGGANGVHTKTVGNGGSDTAWDASHGIGGGGGGARAVQNGGTGGNYGGGAGLGASSGTAAPGIIAITYTPGGGDTSIGGFNHYYSRFIGQIGGSNV